MKRRKKNAGRKEDTQHTNTDGRVSQSFCLLFTDKTRAPCTYKSISRDRKNNHGGRNKKNTKRKERIKNTPRGRRDSHRSTTTWT